MGEISSRVIYEIDFSGGNFQLKRVDTCDVSFDADSEIVTAGGVRGGAGYRDQEGGGTIQIEVYAETGDPEVNYLRLFFSKEQFNWVIEMEGGMRLQFRYVKVTKPPGFKFDSKGSSMLTVEMKFLQFGEL